MKLEHPGIEWLLRGEPRPGQIEALARSYTGYAYRDHRDDTPERRPLAHAGHHALGWGHWMQMRVGKTPTCLNEYMLLKAYHGIRLGVIFAPNNFKNTWKTEAENFGVDVPVHVHNTDKRETADWLDKNKEGLVVINYQALIQDEMVRTLQRHVDNETYVSLDESVSIKNPTSTTYKRLVAATKQARIKRTMTGKPAPQSPLDYFTQLQYIGATGNQNQFGWRASFCEMGGFKGKKITGVKNEAKLAGLIQANTFFAKRKDWAKYLESDYNTVNTTMSDVQKRMYDEMEKDFVAWLSESDFVAVEMAAHRHAKLQQISSGFLYGENGEVHQIMPFEETPKFKDFMGYFENEVVDKVIVVYRHKAVGKMLMDALAAHRPALIAGTQLMSELGLSVEAEKKRFNNDPECRILIGQCTSVKYGHTLMGTEQNPCIDLAFFENSYSLDDRSQVEERPQGEAQIEALVITDFVSSKAEAHVVKALQAKESVFKAIMDYYR